MNRIARRSMAGLAALALMVLVSGVLTAPATASEPARIDVNKATAEELTQLRGIGPAKAKRIVEYREKHGPFATVDDLKLVRGIGDRLLEQLRPHVTTGNGGTAEKDSGTARRSTARR